MAEHKEKIADRKRIVNIPLPYELYIALRLEALYRDMTLRAVCIARLAQTPLPTLPPIGVSP